MNKLKALWTKWQSFSFRKRLTVYLLSLFAIFLFVFPYIIEVSIEEALKDKGATKAEVEDVDFNLFTGKISVTNLYAEFPNEEPLKLGYFKVDFDWLSLFRQRAVIEQLEIHNVVVEVEIAFEPEKFVSIGGIKIPLKESEKVEKEEEEPSSWRIGVKTLSLVKSKLHFIAPKVDKRIDFERVSVTGFQNWQPDEAARLSFDIDVGEGTFVGNFDLKPFSETQVADGTLIFDDFLLQSYHTLFDEHLKVADARLDGRLSVVLKNHFGEIHAANKGFLSISDAAIERNELNAKVKRLHWEGNILADYAGGALQLKTHSNIQLDDSNLDLGEMNVGVNKLRVNGDYAVELQDEQMHTTTAQNILLSQFSFKQQDQLALALDEFDWKGASASDIRGENIDAQLEGELNVQQFSVDQADLSLGLEKTHWAGRVETNKEGETLDVFTDGLIALQQLGLKQADNKVDIASVDWSGPVKVHQSDQNLNAKVEDGKLKLSQVAVQQKEKQVLLEQGDWNGTVLLDKQGDHLSLDNKTELLLTKLGLSQPDMRIDIDTTALNSQIRVDQTPENLKVETKDQKNTQDITVKTGDITLKTAKVTWDGQTEVNQPQDKDARVDVKGKTSLVTVRAYQKDIKVGAAGVYWSGKVKVRPGTDREVEVNGYSSLSKVALSNPKQKVTVVSFDRLKTNMGFAAPQSVDLSKFSMQEIDVAKRDQDARAMLKLKEIKVSHFKMPDTQTFDIGAIVLSGLDAVLEVDPEKRIHQLDATTSALKTEDSKPTETEAQKTVKKSEKSDQNTKSQPTSKLNFHLTSFDMEGENKIDVTTLATDPKMEKKIQILKAHVGEVDTKKPTQDTPVELKIKVDKYTKATISGQGQPFNEKINGHLKAKIDDMDLYSFSPLIKRDLGYRIQSGSLNMESQTEVKEDYLTSKNHVLLAGFEMEADESKAEKSTEQTSGQPATSDTTNGQVKAEPVDNGRPISPVALKFGLDMIRDSNDNIDLDLPVEGDLNDPDFDASSAINVAMRNVLKAGTKVALTMALQPFGAIAVASQYAYGQATKIRFEPVVFEDGENKMKPEMGEYLNKLSKVLKDKKGITLKVCGYYTPQDIAFWQKQGLEGKVLNQKVYELAKERQQLVKDTIIQQGVASKRMTTCHPVEEKQPVSGVSISM